MSELLSPAASDDLINIWAYGADHWGLSKADEYNDRLIEMILFLAENPTFGKQRDDIKSGYMSYAIGSHVIFFKISNPIYVLRILHQRMDVERHLLN